MKNKGKNIKLKDRVITQCDYCNKSFSYDKNKGWAFDGMCRECVKKRRNSFPVYVSDLDYIKPGFTDILILAFEEDDE